MNKLSAARRTQVIKALVEGNSIRATCRMTDTAKGTVTRLLVDIGKACAAYHDEVVRGLTAQRVQCDEIWSFCHAKQKNVPADKRGEFGYGDVWTWTAIDADTKLVISYLVGLRDAGYAHEFMQDVASRISTRVQLTTDGHKPYLQAVEGAFGADVDYAVLMKLYGPDPGGERRYSPPVCIGTTATVVQGTPDRAHVSTSYVERQNLTMRMHMRRFTRLTNGFSKKLENHVHMIAIYTVFYNFTKVHKTLRVTPAMQAGLTDHVWSMEEIVRLLEDVEAPVPVAQAN